MRKASSKLQVTATGHSQMNVTSSSKSSEIFVTALSLSASILVNSKMRCFLSSGSTITLASRSLETYSSGLLITIFCLENLCPFVILEESLSIILILTSSLSKIDKTHLIGRENLTSLLPHLIK